MFKKVTTAEDSSSAAMVQGQGVPWSPDGQRAKTQQWTMKTSASGHGCSPGSMLVTGSIKTQQPQPSQ